MSILKHEFFVERIEKLSHMIRRQLCLALPLAPRRAVSR